MLLNEYDVSFDKKHCGVAVFDTSASAGTEKPSSIPRGDAKVTAEKPESVVRVMSPRRGKMTRWVRIGLWVSVAKKILIGFNLGLFHDSPEINVAEK